MTVKELIEALSQIENKDLRVMTRGYEGGWNDLITQPREFQVALNVNDKWYYGAHERIENVLIEARKDYQIIKAIIL